MDMEAAGLGLSNLTPLIRLKPDLSSGLSVNRYDMKSHI